MCDEIFGFGKMTLGLSKDQFEILNCLVIQPLKERKAKVYVFGSRARGKYHPFSDIDIMHIETIGSAISAQEFSKILEEVEESSLSIRVDLVNFKEIAASYKSNA